MPDHETKSVELVVRAQSGDAQALNQVLKRYLPRLKRWASGRLPWGLRTMLDTNDLVQEALIKALPHIATLEIRTDRALQFYLQRAVKNRIIDLKKRAGIRPAREELSENIEAAGASPQDAAAAVEAFEQFQRALASLKKDERRAIMLRIELDLGYDELATQLGKPTADAARVAVSRAIVRLAQRMGARPERPSTRGSRRGSTDDGCARA